MPISESQFNKTTSNYVIQEKHQTTDKGDIFERDITTISGRNYFDRYQRPVYRSSNFIITTSNETSTPRPPIDVEWDKSPEKGEELWTWEDVEEASEEVDTSASIELKPDVNDLRSFAYYGSCVELIRASLNHIFATFPGEVYATEKTLKFAKNNNASYEFLGGSNYKLVDNPFNLNLHAKYVDNYFIEQEPLKYFFANDSYKLNYEFIDSNNKHYPISNVSYTPKNGDCFTNYDELGVLTITPSGASNVEISVFKAPGDAFIYMSKTSKWHIRPKESFYADFRKNLGLFEKTLLSESTQPKYAPNFQVYTETDLGFSIRLEQFVMPIGEGGYNIDCASPAYGGYVGKLSKIATLYDEYFSDNLYRCMTHEAIKNFDWSFQRDLNPALSSENENGGNRIMKMLRVVAREFDEIKLYIDGIKHANNLSYDGKDNIPDYLLTDMVENEGWDYKHVIPYCQDKDEKGNFFKDEEGNDITGYTEYYKNVTPYSLTEEQIKSESCDKDYALTPVSTYKDEIEYTPNDVNNLFTRLLCLNSREIWRKKGTINSIDSLLSLFGLKNKEWVDKMCELKDKYKKGSDARTDCPLKCPNWISYSTIDPNDYDYEIVEYVSKINEPIVLNEEDRNFWLDVNNAKLLTYQEDVFINLPPTPWRGLMVKEFQYELDDKDEIEYRLYPWFDLTNEYDGSPYYQMHGGWLEKEVSVDKNDNLINIPYFTETISKIRGVNNIAELLNLNKSILHEGDICYVSDLSKRYMIIEGYAYELRPYVYKDNEIEGCFYFECSVKNGSVVIGEHLYSNTLHIIEPYMTSATTYEMKKQVKPIEQYADNAIVKVFVRVNEEENTTEFELTDQFGNKPKYIMYLSANKTGFEISDDSAKIAQLIGDSTKYENIATTDEEKGDPTHYFILNNIDFSSYINFVNANSNNQRLGWVQLTTKDEDYKHLSMIENYYKGNNPHTHANPSDSGFGYIERFAKLFKYSVDNNLFDWNSLYLKYNMLDSESQSDFISKVKNFGFKELTTIKNEETNETYESCSSYNIIPDTKIHYTEHPRKDDDISYDVKDFGKDKDQVNSDEIINTKRVDIIFNCDSTQMNEKLKYIDNIVLPYLTQVIPAGILMKVSYKKP